MGGLQPFYKDDFDEDEERVNCLFEGADENGISVQKKVLTKEEMIKFIRQGYLLIVLVNSLALPRTWKKSSQEAEGAQQSSRFSYLKSQFSSLTSSILSSAIRVTGSYIGHFILLMDYVEGADCFTYRDPGVRDRETPPSPPLPSSVLTSNPPHFNRSLRNFWRRPGVCPEGQSY